MNLSDLSVIEVHDTRPDRLIQNHHYLQSTPAGARHRYLISAGIRYGIVGAALWGRPVARNIDQQNHIELTRFWTHSQTPPNAESYVLSRMMDELDHYDLLHAYASVGRHEGTIYRATNWVNMGLRWPADWSNRDGRTMRDHGVKWKFEYW